MHGTEGLRCRFSGTRCVTGLFRLNYFLQSSVPSQALSGSRQELQFGFGHNPERTLAADYKVHPFHAGRERVTGGVLSRARQRFISSAWAACPLAARPARRGMPTRR